MAKTHAQVEIHGPVATQRSRHYVLRCTVCGAAYEDDGFLLDCPVAHEPGLLVTDYGATHLEADATQSGIFRFHQWLPIQSPPRSDSRGVVYRSMQLSGALGMSDLWVAFSGSWPERGANLPTGSFKDLEALTVLARLPAGHNQTLVLASAGNTAAAFARACSETETRCVIVVPAIGMNALAWAGPLAKCVTIISIGGGADYADAINLANQLASLDGWVAEGGAKNVARRDGIGTVMLDATETIGRLPDYYVQAVGSGTGGIAVHEAARRLRSIGYFGTRLPRLMLCQNLPFAPIHRAWQTRQRALLAMKEPQAKREIRSLLSPVLSNRTPPYAIAGGVYDALLESDGETLVATNAQALHAMTLFRECEGIELDPAAGVALACLSAAVESGSIDRSSTVLLHVTGGGRSQTMPRSVPIAIEVDLDRQPAEQVLDTVLTLVHQRAA
jgi:cysteate synthase